MPTWFEPITPKKKELVATQSLKGELEREMRRYANNVAAECAQYEAPPTPIEWVTRTRNTARGRKGTRYVKRGYKRTRTLGRSWGKRVYWAGSTLWGVVYSSGNIAPYNVYVRGPKKGRKGKRQSEIMVHKGWRSIDDIQAQMWPPEVSKFNAIIKRAGK